MTIWQAKIFRI